MGALDIAVEFIKGFEGCHKKRPDGRYAAYPDPIYAWKVATVGWGTTRYPNGVKVKKGDVITKAQADEYLLHEVTKCLAAVKRIPTATLMNQNQLAALTSFAYNLGAGFYRGANRQSITRVCDSPARWQDADWITAQFVKYCNPNDPNATAGLKRRRRAEASLFLKTT